MHAAAVMCCAAQRPTAWGFLQHVDTASPHTQPDAHLHASWRLLSFQGHQHSFQVPRHRVRYKPGQQLPVQHNMIGEAGGLCVVRVARGCGLQCV